MKQRPPALERPGDEGVAPGQLTRAAHNKLREAFAAQALCGLLSGSTVAHEKETYANAAWEIADAMMAARAR